MYKFLAILFFSQAAFAQELAPVVPTVAPPVSIEATKPKPVIVKKTAAPPKPYLGKPADPYPSFTPRTDEFIRRAIGDYNKIANEGGWGVLPNNPSALQVNQRLSLTKDLEGEATPVATAQAISRFQRRHGLAETGKINAQTLKEMNVPVASRIQKLEYSLARLAPFTFSFSERYVIVNLPSAEVEMVENGVVTRKHLAIVGKPDRASPLVETRLTVVNFNPTWTVPVSIIKKDMIPKMQKDPQALAKMKIRILDRSGDEVNPATINWSNESAVNYTLRQDAGTGNSLGQIRIDMPNTEAVFMHDTPSKKLFKGVKRFHSSGCVRVEYVRDFAAWLLEPQGGTRALVDKNLSDTKRKDIRLTKAVPVAWIYLTGWAEEGGMVHFRDDIYGFDKPENLDVKVARAPQRKSANATPVEEAPPVPQEIKEKSFFDLFFNKN